MIWVTAFVVPTKTVITHRHSPARLGKELGAIVGLVSVVNALMMGLVGV